MSLRRLLSPAPEPDALVPGLARGLVLYQPREPRQRAGGTDSLLAVERTTRRSSSISTLSRASRPAGNGRARSTLQLRRADVLIFLGTEAAVDSKWCHTELAMSRSLGRTILPLRLDEGTSHPLVGDRQWIPLTLDGADSLKPLQRALERLDIEALDTLDWDIDPIAVSRAGVLRREPGRRLLRPHRGNRECARPAAPSAPAGHRASPARRGASGCGKSSLVRAGVLPRLRRLEPSWLAAHPMLPRGSLLKALATSFAVASEHSPDASSSG